MSVRGTGWEAMMSRFVLNFATDKSGVTAIEYGLITALIAVIIVTAVSAMGTGLVTTFNSVAASL
jgi:pilus assembly protein Flp/PilA